MIEVDSLPELIDGVLLKGSSQHTVWWIYDGIRYGIPSPDALFAAGYSFDDVYVVPDRSLSTIPTAPQDGSIIHEQGTGEAYVVYGGVRFRAQDTDFGPGRDFRLEDVIVAVPRGYLAAIPEGGPYRRRLCGKFGRFFIWFRVKERAPKVQRWASLGGAFALGVSTNLITWVITR